MLQLIHARLEAPDPDRRIVALRTDRHTLARRRWRGTADDGSEFGFELELPLRHGDAFHQTAVACYTIVQQPEPVVEIPLDLPPSAVAGIGWAIGNLHLQLQAEAGRLLAADEPAVHRLLERLQVPFRATTAVFRPGHFACGARPAQELGPAHTHEATKVER